MTKNTLVLSVVCCFSVFSVNAQEGVEIKAKQNQVPQEEADENINAIQDITVTAPSESRQLEEVPMSMSIIDSQQIKRAAVTSVGELFRDIPGLDILDTGVLAGQKRIMIRGESGSRVLVLVDGQKISEQKSMDGAALLMSMNSIERIEVIKGPSSVLYGAEGMGGIINVITRKEGEEVFQLEASSAFNTNTNGWDNYLSAFGGGEELAGFGYRFSLSHSDHGNQHGPDREELKHTEFNNGEGSALLVYDLGVVSDTDIKISATANRYRSETNAFLYQDTISPTPPDGWQLWEAEHADRWFSLYLFWEFKDMQLPQWDRDKDALLFEWENISDTLEKVKIETFRQTTTKHFIAEPFIAPAGWWPHDPEWYNHATNRFAYIHFISDTKNDQQSDNISMETNWRFGNHELVLGGLHMKDGLEAVAQTTYQPGALVSVDNYGIKTEWVNSQRITQDIYLQDKWAISQRWLMTMGARYSDIDSELTSYKQVHEHLTDPVILANFGLDTSAPTETIIKPPQSSNESYTNYSFGLINHVSRDLDLRFHYGTSHTLPTLSQLFIWSNPSGRLTKPNPDLKPESAESYEIGARFNNKRWNIDLALYTTIADDYIYNVELSNVEQRLEEASNQWQNINKAETQGVELLLDYNYIPWGLTPYISGDFIQRKFTFDNGFSTYDTGLPEVNGRFGVRYEYGFGGASLFWADIYGRASQQSKKADRDGHVRYVDGWETANLSMGLDWFSGASEIELIINVNNIFDERYFSQHDSVMISPGRHLAVKLNMSF